MIACDHAINVKSLRPRLPEDELDWHLLVRTCSSIYSTSECTKSPPPLRGGRGSYLNCYIAIKFCQTVIGLLRDNPQRLLQIRNNVVNMFDPDRNLPRSE